MAQPPQHLELTFKLRRDEAADWAFKNPVLADGEPGLEKDTRRIKYGDGVSPWNDLPYSGEPLPDDGGASNVAVAAHIADETPHPVYDEGPSLLLLYENAKV